jgi:hypothetical protein
MNPWRVLTMVLAAGALALGLFGIVNPDALVALGEYAITPTGLYVIAAVRIVFGAILVLAATAARMPRLLRVLGVIIVIAGVLTPLYGVDRWRAQFDWLVSLGPMAIRLVGLAMMVVGGLIFYAVSPSRQRA